MTERDWIMLAAGLLSGGAMGAVITALVTKYRNRRQPVGFKKEIIEIFKKNPEVPALQAILMIGERPGSGPGLAFENLSLARFTLVNKGNQDIEEFKFGVTLTGENKAIDVKMETPDRHHIMTLTTPVGLTIPPKKELDFILKPFNRGESYNLNVYYTYTDVQGTIDLSSAHSTKFVEIGVTGEIVADAAESLPVIGPFVSLFKSDKGRTGGMGGSMGGMGM